MGAPLDFLRAAFKYQEDACLLWPFGKTEGYGSVGWEGQVTRAHRVVCKEVHGPRPTPDHEVAHSCGVRACIAPRHLRWATPVENQGDRPAHGTDSRGEKSGTAKLTSKQVQEIRASTASQRTLAKVYGVSSGHINKIRKGQKWSHL